jgi:hypothetical protein
VSSCVVKGKSHLTAYGKDHARQNHIECGLTVMMMMMMMIMVMINGNSKSGKDELSHNAVLAYVCYLF